DSLQQCILVDSDKRARDRLFWPHPVKVIPLNRDGQQEEPIQCRGKDLSPTGIGFYIPHEVPTSMVLIELENPVDSRPVLVPASLVRARRCADGWYDIGAVFRIPSPVVAAAEVKV